MQGDVLYHLPVAITQFVITWDRGSWRGLQAALHLGATVLQLCVHLQCSECDLSEVLMKLALELI